MAQTETESQKTVLKNQLQANFKGISFVANDNSPAIVSNSAENGNSKNLVLESWSEPDANSVEFKFTDGSAVRFSVTDSTPNAALTITAFPSEPYDTLSIAYKTASGYSIKETSPTRLLLNTRDKTYSFSAPQIDANRIAFSKENALASFTTYDPSQHFEYTAVAGLEGSDADSYSLKIKQLKDSVVTLFERTASSSSSASLTEKEVVAYVAEMCKREKYNEAIGTVPSLFKQGNKRTYLSSPFFANLVAMDQTLVSQTQRIAALAQSALNDNNLDIFTVEGISDYILREKKKPASKQLLSMPSAAESFRPTQASGILTVYAKLYEADQDTAALLAPAIDSCIKVIQENTKLEDGIITITENDAPLMALQAIQTGWALLQTGRISSRAELQDAGRLIINQNINSATLENLSILAEVYPLLTQNENYPHTQILGYYGTECAWAWTSANSIDYNLTSNGIVNIRIDFPITYSHYIIMKGIPTFHSNIEIQALRFRTDPRFESYNSSGYVYNEASRTFFLKSRHKAQVELVRLFCDPTSNFTQK